MTPLWTASATKRAVKCRFPVQIGRTFESSPVGAQAQSGTLIHGLSEGIILSRLRPGYVTRSVVEIAKLSDLDLDLLDIELCRERAHTLGNYAIDRIGGESFNVEQAYGYDPALLRGYPVESSGHRDYRGVMPEHIGMTIDLSFLEERDGITTLVIVDHKTGRLENVDHPRENWQLLTACVALSDLDSHAEFEQVRSEIWHVDERCELRVLGHTHSADELNVARRTISRTAEQIVFGNTPATPGEHCASTYCPALSECPAIRRGTAQLAHATVNESPPRKWPHGEIVTQSEAIDVLTLLPAIERYLKLRKAEANAIADSSDGLIDGDLVYRKNDISTQKISPDAAEVIAEMHGLECVDEIAPRSLSKTRLEQKLGRSVARETIGKLQALGLVTTRTTSRYGWKKREQQERAE